MHRAKVPLSDRPVASRSWRSSNSSAAPLLGHSGLQQLPSVWAPSVPTTPSGRAAARLQQVLDEQGLGMLTAEKKGLQAHCFPMGIPS